MDNHLCCDCIWSGGVKPKRVFHLIISYLRLEHDYYHADMERAFFKSHYVTGRRCELNFLFPDIKSNQADQQVLRRIAIDLQACDVWSQHVSPSCLATIKHPNRGIAMKGNGLRQRL
ncbi:hypothetical protein TNCV_798111 [Trichonephila clavipes]|nr:hypothetical protein TNCV_798111 [Trichonephila clavipes]